MLGLLRPRTLLALAVLLVVAYAGISWVFSDKLIAPAARPLGKVDPTAYGLPKPTVVEVPGKGGVQLASWYFPNPRNEHCAVVMLHGFGGARGEVVGASPLFWDRGCDLLMYDSRGHGDSSPALLTFGPHEKEDLVAAIAWLSKRTKLADRRIGLIGWSYGAAVSIQAAAKVPGIGFVIADSSYSSLDDIARVQADDQFGSWAKIFVPGALFIAGKRAGFDPGNADPAGEIRDVKAPVLLIHSRQDGFTPYQHSEKIYAASNKARTRLVIPPWAAPHALSYTRNPAAYTRIVDRFLQQFKLSFGTRKGA
jgi:dipeptidyl aminopeptidase/acylaminoacyl peptidase